MQMHQYSETAKSPETIFHPTTPYQFPENCHNQRNFARVELFRKVGVDEVTKLTGVQHPNIIALKKIAKPKKNSEKDLGREGLVFYLLYYEEVPFSLWGSLRKSALNVKPETLKNTLSLVKNYLLSFSITMEFLNENVGVTEAGSIKVFIPPEIILKERINSMLQIEEMQRSIKQICR